MTKTRTYEIELKGEYYENADGSSRQEEIARCRKGDKVFLKHRPRNEHSSTAIAVLSERSVQIGFVAQEQSIWLLKYVNEDRVTRSVIGNIWRREEGQTSQVWLDVTVRLSTGKPAVDGVKNAAIPPHPTARSSARKHVDGGAGGCLSTGVVVVVTTLLVQLSK